MILLGIDPGYEQSALVFYDTERRRVLAAATGPNDQALNTLLHSPSFDAVCIEQIASYGMAVGREVFETVFWTGRFFQVVKHRGLPVDRMVRRDVKMHLCANNTAKDSNIRQALIDKFPRTGGGKCPQIGLKKSPGPLFGISGDCWAALAVAVTWAETRMHLFEADGRLLPAEWGKVVA